MEPTKLNKFIKKLKENKKIILLGIILAFTIVFFVLVISGKQDCEVVSLREGVISTCTCRGFEITVKSNAISAETKTVCLGQITTKNVYK